MSKSKAIRGASWVSLFLMMALASLGTAFAGEKRDSKDLAVVPATFVSSDSKAWVGRWERGDTFRMTTELRLPDSLARTDRPVPKNVAFVFDTVASCDATLSDDGRTLTLTGRVFNSTNARDVVLQSIDLEYPDGTVYRQDGIGVRLTETKDYYYYDDGGGCGIVGYGAFALILPLFLLTRRRSDSR